MESEFKRAKDIIKKYNQEHLLMEYDKLDVEKQKLLINQILNIDFELINKLFEKTKEENNSDKEEIAPIKYIEKEKLSKEEKDKYFEIGANEIKNGQFAVVTMAGRTRNKTSDILDLKEHMY